MKRISAILCVIFLCGLLAACGGPDAAKAGTESLGIDWSVTPDQVREALKLPEDALSGGVLTAQGIEAFGGTALKGEFHFLEDSKGQLRLSRVHLIYPDDADMAQVRQALEKAFGTPVEQYQEYDHSGVLSTLRASDSLAFWHSSQTVASCAADPAFPLREDWQASLDAISRQDEAVNAGGKLAEFYQQAPAVRLFWTDNGQIPYIQGDQPKNAVYFDAGMLALMR
ncbi:MAG: hypothetical protein Q4F17_06900 [Eubacteriales bacterium]|nr:hypothetical protein [Eubacteriales bacterium]